MSIDNMFGELDKIDILAETKTGEVVMVLVCNGFIDGSPETQKALLDKMEGYLNHTQSEEFQKEYGGWPAILRVSSVGNRMSASWHYSANAPNGRMITV